METKIIDGKEYTKVGIKEFSINGEKKENSFSSNDIDNQCEIYFDIKIDYNADDNSTSFTTNSLDSNSTKLNNSIKISSEPTVKTSTSNENFSDTKDKDIS